MNNGTDMTALATATANLFETQADEQEEQDGQLNVVELSKEALKESGKVFSNGRELVGIKGEEIIPLQKPNLKFFIKSIAPSLNKTDIMDIAEHIMSDLDGAEGFPMLERVTTQPTFRPDFTLVSPGYDPSTRLFYKPAADVVAIQPKTTAKDAKDALKRFQYLFADFPFHDEASRTNTIATLVTLVVRHAINDVVPAWACNGLNEFSQNVGKGKINKAMTVIAFGKEPKITTVPPTPTQMLQTLSAEIMRGASYVIFDDIQTGRRLESNDMNAFLTAGAWNCKVPGTIKSYEMPVKLVTMFNGNNLRASIDLTNRMCWSDLYHENTQSRDVNKFRIFADHGIQFDEFLTRHRVALLNDVLTMVLAWKAAGMPQRKASSPLVKYSTWERIIGGIVEFAGAKDFLSNQKAKSEASDEKTQYTIAFLLKLLEYVPHIQTMNGVRQSEVAAALLPGRALADMLPDMPRSENGIGTAFGKWVKAVEGRIFGGHKLKSWNGTGNKAYVRLEKV